MLPRNHPDRIHITFDDRRLVANVGLLLPATLARHLGLPELVRQRLDLGDAPGRANTSDKMMTLVASALAGGDCIESHRPGPRLSSPAYCPADPATAPLPRTAIGAPNDNQRPPPAPFIGIERGPSRPTALTPCSNPKAAPHRWIRA